MNKDKDPKVRLFVKKKNLSNQRTWDSQIKEKKLEDESDPKFLNP